MAHEVAEEVDVVLWCRVGEDQWEKCELELGPGWWVVSPEAAAKVIR